VAEIDLIGGEEGGDPADGALDFCVAGGSWEGKGLAGGFDSGAMVADFGAALAASRDALVGGMVVEAEGFVAESGRAAGVGGRGGRGLEGVPAERPDIGIVVSLMHGGPLCIFWSKYS